MTNKDRIVQILLDYTKEKQIHVSQVILELYADELIKEGITFRVRCKECVHRTVDGHCFVCVEGAGYLKTHDDGYCDKGTHILSII